MDKNMHYTGRIALCGVLGALVIVCLTFATILPTSRLAFYVLGSFFISVVIIECGTRTGWLFYIATCLLSLVILPDKLGIVPYCIFFGIYGLIKFYIEKIKSIIPELIIKLVYFNLCLLAAYYLARQLFADITRVTLPWWLVIAGLEAVFIIYDYVYTLFIVYYKRKLEHLIWMKKR
jgi:hypothetical protein